MCGVIGFIHEKHQADLGRIACELLRTLEYRGYDSTGAAIQDEAPEVDLRKDVGAPSKIAERLGIHTLSGRVLAAQVRWATFGAVDATNAQPHVVRCKTFIYGAHNGNVTNSDDLKAWLTSEGHRVLSDNDGEMVVHTVEHFFALELAEAGAAPTKTERQAAMRRAIQRASQRIKGSYAAVIVDPFTHTISAIKKGSSLYFGVGESDGSRFGIASSDLSAVLKLTHMLVPLAEGEVAEFEATRHQILKLADGSVEARAPKKSRLRAQDTGLSPGFTTFMEQEIHAQIETSAAVVRSFTPGRPDSFGVRAALDAMSPSLDATILGTAERVRELAPAAAEVDVRMLAREPTFGAILEQRPILGEGLPLSALESSERALFEELSARATSKVERATVALLDAALAREEERELRRAIDAIVERIVSAGKASSRVFLVCCGSSFHAAKTAALFMNKIARAEVLPLLPGELRGQYGENVRDGDVYIAISQSGETKDLIDVLNDARSTGKRITTISLVNNLNSTLAQEKSDLVLPLRCGPEIAVAATKSFINQLAVLFGLALEVGRRTNPGPALEAHAEAFTTLPDLIERTIQDTDATLDEIAKLLFLRPSVHILAARFLGIAKEGALKIREVVLNHTEGFEASEFKHGPNTILGLNTIFGLDQLERMLSPWGEKRPTISEAIAATYVDYPLVYISGPEQRDLDLTISQINTHKIRGASTVVIAEEQAGLRLAAEKPPADNPTYRAIYAVLPKATDPLLVAFTATVAMQRLALKMSLMKKAHLDALGIKEHGVHPDVPKNVSKSITVD
ncbi:MAG: SIS domain-containing protein [Myxococcota bacterium]